MWHILEISISIILRRKHQKQLILLGNIVKLCDFNNAKHLKIVGSEGTNTNLGNKGGVIFHGNELPLRHLFVKLDGCTTGPQSFSGPIGNAIKELRFQPTIFFSQVFESSIKIIVLSQLQHQSIL